MAYISSKRAYKNKFWNRGVTFFTLKRLSIWYKSVTQRLPTLLVRGIFTRLRLLLIMFDLIKDDDLY